MGDAYLLGPWFWKVLQMSYGVKERNFWDFRRIAASILVRLGFLAGFSHSLPSNGRALGIGDLFREAPIFSWNYLEGFHT